MNFVSTRKGVKLQKAIAWLTLFLTGSQSLAAQQFHREFLSDGAIVNISAVRIDEKHAALSAVQITREDYRETRILDPRDGTTQIWEISRPDLQVTYSLPYRGKFLKMEAQKREKTGLRKASFVLSRDNSHYTFVRESFRKYQIFHLNSDFSTVPVCQVPAEPPVDITDIDPALQALQNSPLTLASRSLDSSCKKPPFASEHSAIVEGLARVISTRESLSPSSGKFLFCMNAHHLNYFSEHMKADFLKALQPKDNATVFCRKTDNANAGEYDEEHNKIYFDLPASYAGVNTSERANFYSDTFFHESLHKAGIESEEMVGKIVECCGEQKGAGTQSSCSDLDALTEKTNKRNARLIANAEKLDGFKDLWEEVEKSTDEQRVNTFFDDLTEKLRNGQYDSAGAYSACIEQNGIENEESCVHSLVSNINNGIAKYFDKDCLRLFKDRNTSQDPNSAKNYCQKLSTETQKIVDTNSFKVCNPDAKTIMERSCLYAAKDRKEDIIQDAYKAGSLVESPDITVDINARSTNAKFRESYFTAFAHYMPDVKMVLDKLKDKFEKKRTLDLFYSLIKNMGPTSKNMQGEYEACIKKRTPVNTCAIRAKNSFFKSLDDFFKIQCRAYFTKSEGKSRPCKEIKEDIKQVINGSIAGGCKQFTPDSNRIGSEKNDLTCLFKAIEEGGYNLDHYAELKVQGKLLDDNNSPSSLLADQQKQEAAERVVRTTSINLPDEAKKDAARGIASLPAPGNTANNDRVYRFNPDDASDMKRLKDQVSDDTSLAKSAIASAANWFSDLAVPRASAQSTENQESFTPSAPQAPAPLTSEKGPSSNGASISGIGSVAGHLEESSLLAGAPQSSSSQRATAQAQNSKAQSSNPDPSSATPGEETGAARSGGPSKSRKSRSKPSAGAGSAKIGAGGASEAGAPQRSPAASNGRDLNPKEKLYKLFKDDPVKSLSLLKNGSLSDELANYSIEVKDDEGISHGSPTPEVKIWYDRQSQGFMGVPEP